MGKKGVLLVGHGSTMPYNKELVEKTASLIKGQNTDFIVKCGFMNMNTPTIKESLNEFRHEPIDALVVVPLFLAKGVHIDPFANVFSGTCSGIILGNINQTPLHDIWKNFHPNNNQTIKTLFKKGPAAMLKHTPKTHYATKCHLCTKTRTALQKQNLTPQTIGPKQSY